MLVEASLEHLGKTAIEAKSGTLLYNIYFLLRFSSKSQILLYRISLNYTIIHTPNSVFVPFTSDEVYNNIDASVDKIRSTLAFEFRDLSRLMFK